MLTVERTGKEMGFNDDSKVSGSSVDKRGTAKSLNAFAVMAGSQRNKRGSPSTEGDPLLHLQDILLGVLFLSGAGCGVTLILGVAVNGLQPLRRVRSPFRDQSQQILANGGDPYHGVEIAGAVCTDKQNVIRVFRDRRRRRIGDQAQPHTGGLCGLTDMDVGLVEAGDAQIDQHVLTAGAIERRVNIIGVLEEDHIVLYIAESPRKMLRRGACGAVSEDVDIPAGSQ